MERADTVTEMLEIKHAYKKNIEPQKASTIEGGSYCFMLYGVFADIVVLIHFLWIIFLIAGAYWGRKFPRVRIVHITGLGFAIVSQVFGWYCPLTHLEVWLREQHDPTQAYPGSFIAYYAEQLVYITVTPKIIFFLTIVLIGINILIYVKAFREKTGSSEAR
jgi:hypothetical protein